MNLFECTTPLFDRDYCLSRACLGKPLCDHRKPETQVRFLCLCVGVRVQGMIFVTAIQAGRGCAAAILPREASETAHTGDCERLRMQGWAKARARAVATACISSSIL